jgi:hypothetical protein
LSRALGVFVIVGICIALGCGPTIPPSPPGEQGETCGIGDLPKRDCVFGLKCVQRPVAAVEPKDKEQIATEGDWCAGIMGRGCASGLKCMIAAADKYTMDAAGTCRVQFVCVAR